MVVSELERKELEEIYVSLFHNEKVRKMLEIPMHRGSNCFIHSFKVAKLAIKRAMRHKKVDLKIILYAAVFHDYYLYDWRKNKELLKGHGKHHPDIAIENAVRDFGINDEVKRVIKTHMWPVNIKAYPNTKEAKIVSLSDKGVTIGESLTSIKYKQRKREKYLSYISTLF